jgi:multidrug transporter EmrE-like cation transporter
MNEQRWAWLTGLATEAGLFVVYSTVSVVALTLLKTAMSAFRPAIASGAWSDFPVLTLLAGAACYATGFAMWLLLLTRHPIGVAYPVSVGFTVTAVLLVDLFWFRRLISTTELIGVAVILAGIVVVFTAGSSGDGAVP